MENEKIDKLKKSNKALMFILIIILLIIIGAASYSYFVWIPNRKDNTVDVSKLVADIPYWFLLDETSKTVKQLSTLDIVNVAYQSLDKSYEIKYDSSDILPTKDNDGVIYPEYNEIDEIKCSKGNNGVSNMAGTLGNLKKIWQSMYFSTSEIEKMDPSLWSCVYDGFGNFTTFYVVDKVNMEEKILELFGTDNNIFDKSFVYNTSYDKQYICGTQYYIYDESVEKLIIFYSGGCTAGIQDKTYVMDEYKEKDEYKLEIVEVRFNNYIPGYYEDTVEIYKGSEFRKDAEVKPVLTLEINNKSEEKLLEDEIEKVKDKLDHYKLTFKKVGDNYQFVNIDYLD